MRSETGGGRSAPRLGPAAAGSLGLLLAASLLLGPASSPAACQRAGQQQQQQQLEPSAPAWLDYAELGRDNDSLYINKLLRRIVKRLSSVYQDLNHLSSSEQLEAGAARRPARPPLAPVLLVPGYGGSKLEARWKRSSARRNCPLESDWHLIWCDPKYLVLHTSCLSDNFRLEFDPATNSTRSPAGVEVRVKGAHRLESVEQITETGLLGVLRFDYFSSIARALIAKLGYARDQNLRGAAYDFRRAPNELAEYFDTLRATVEQMCAESNGRALTLICHSMGCNNMLYFLQRQPSAWKRTHIRRLISLAAPWGGSMKALKAVAIGDNLNVPQIILDGRQLNEVQRSLPSTIYLLPHEKVFGQQPLISMHTHIAEQQAAQPGQPLGANQTQREQQVAQRQQVAEQSSGRIVKEFIVAGPEGYEKFFNKLKHPDGYRMYQLTKDLLNDLRAPEVELWCLYGHRTETLSQLEFLADFPNSSEKQIYSDGDGTVSWVSLTYCSQWAQQQSQPIHLRAFLTDHQEILEDDDVIDLIKQILEQDSAVDDQQQRADDDWTGPELGQSKFASNEPFSEPPPTLAQDFSQRSEQSPMS